jgi:hypothetical protein
MENTMLSERAVVLSTGLRVQRFLDVNVPVLAAVNGAGARKTLDAAVGALSTQANTQEATKQKGQGETKKQRALRVALEKQMRAIDHIGRSVLTGVPELATLRMPAANVSTQVLLEKAAAMAQTAAAHVSIFTDAGLPADFLTQLQAACDAIPASQGDRDEAGNSRVAATAATEKEATRIRRAVKVLDSLVKLQLSDTDPLLAAWRSAKRFHVIPVVTPPVVATTTPAPVSPASSAPASHTPEVTKPAAS